MIPTAPLLPAVAPCLGVKDIDADDGIGGRLPVAEPCDHLAPCHLRCRDGHATCRQCRDGHVRGIDLRVANAGRRAFPPAAGHACLRPCRPGQDRKQQEGCQFNEKWGGG